MGDDDDSLNYSDSLTAGAVFSNPQPVSGPDVFSPLASNTDGLLYATTTGDPVLSAAAQSAGTISGYSNPGAASSSLSGFNWNGFSNALATALGHGTYAGTSTGLSSNGTLVSNGGTATSLSANSPIVASSLSGTNLSQYIPYLILFGALYLIVTALSGK